MTLGMISRKEKEQSAHTLTDFRRPAAQCWKKKTPSAMLNYATSARDTLDLAVSKRKKANPPVLITESDLKPCADFVFLFLFLL